MVIIGILIGVLVGVSIYKINKVERRMIMAKATKCNMCGKKVKFYDDFTLSYQYGYASNYDGSRLNLDLCETCLNKLTTYLIENCKISPIEKDEY